MSYSWMITFSDLTDEVIRKLTDNYLTTHPDASMDYYDLTAQRMINFSQSFGIDVSVLNTLDRSTKPIHDQLVQWMVTCFQMLVSQNLVGLNNDPLIDDKYKWKYQTYNANLKSLSTKITYEMFFTGTMQQNYTRSGGTFSIMC